MAGNFNIREIKQAEVKSWNPRKSANSEWIKLTDGDLEWGLSMAGWNERIVKPEERDACWGWKGSFHRQGYGMFSIDTNNSSNQKGRMTTIQRVSMAIELGRPLKSNEWVVSTCRNPECCNPVHLVVLSEGTHAARKKLDIPTGNHRIYTKEWAIENYDLLFNEPLKVAIERMGLSHKNDPASGIYNRRRVVRDMIKKGELTYDEIYKSKGQLP